MQVRNPKYNAVGSVDCEIEHEVFGWIPFTASPDDVEESGRLIYAAIMAGEHGEIAAYEPPPPKVYTREEIEVLRAKAYADPITGSDRMFSEASRMQLMGEEGWESVRDAAIVRYNEIQAQYPWPAE